MFGFGGKKKSKDPLSWAAHKAKRKVRKESRKTAKKAAGKSGGSIFDWLFGK